MAESIQKGDPRPVLKTAAKEAGGWGGAWAGAVAGAGIGAALGIETGPGALLTGFAGAAVGAYYGYKGVSAVVDPDLQYGPQNPWVTPAEHEHMIRTYNPYDYGKPKY